MNQIPITRNGHELLKKELLQLKSKDQNVPPAKTLFGSTFDSVDNRNLQKNKRRWKVRKTILFSYKPLHN